MRNAQVTRFYQAEAAELVSSEPASAEAAGQSGLQPTLDGRTRLKKALQEGAVGGWDDTGRFIASLDELWVLQSEEREQLYAANASWWDRGGYGGATEEEAMIGDDESDDDVLASLEFLNGLLGRHPRLGHGAALDVGAGVGRVTKHVLLSAFDIVELIEGSSYWSERSKAYIGEPGCSNCRFTTARLEVYRPEPTSYDLIWCQWVLQYLTDADVVELLRGLGLALRPMGVLVVKENRPCTAYVAPTVFLLDTPDGEHRRYDITRPDAHHRLLFERAGLAVIETQRSDDTSFWVLRPLR